MGNCKWFIVSTNFPYTIFRLQTQRVNLFAILRDGIKLAISDSSMKGYDAGDIQFDEMRPYSITLGDDYV